MIYPDLKKYCTDAGKFNTIPVYMVIRADVESPISLFMKTRAKILLESVERGEIVGRYSIIALGKRSTVTLQRDSVEITEYRNDAAQETKRFESPNPLEKVREYIATFNCPEYPDLPPFFGGAIGFLGYETVRYFEDIPVHQNQSGIPDGYLVIPEMILVYDSVKRTVTAVSITSPGNDPDAVYAWAVSELEKISGLIGKNLEHGRSPKRRPGKAEITGNMTEEQYMASVRKAREHIINGDIIQVVLSQKFMVHTETPPIELYRTLRIMNPSPYMYFMDFGEYCVIGSSPEVMVKVQNGQMLLKPIAGTRKRGATMEEDDQIANELINDPKERAEHIMLVDLGRNDLGRVAEAGSVEVTEYMTVEKYSHVMHIVSTVKAKLGKGSDVFDVIRATFPAGTLSGAPKIRAMKIISELEPDCRGPYGGMVLNLGFNGNLDSCITIRTIILKDNLATVQAGAGIVYDSDPGLEYRECVNKAAALICTLQETAQEV